MAIYLRAAIWSGVGAAVMGTALGLATTNALRPLGQAEGPIYPRSTTTADPAWVDGTAECSGCTRYDDGYRWASMHAITQTDSCFDDDWSYQRGCLAYVASTRPY